MAKKQTKPPVDEDEDLDDEDDEVPGGTGDGDGDQDDVPGNPSPTDTPEEPEEPEEPLNNEPPAPPAPPPVTTPPPPTGGQDPKLSEALKCLEEEGLVLGQDTNMSNLVDRLVVACKTKEALHSGLEQDDHEEPEEGETGQEAGNPPSEPGGTGGGGGAGTPPPQQSTPSPIMMSQLTAEQIQQRLQAYDTVLKERDALKREREQLQVSLSSMKQRCDKLEGKVAARRKKELLTDIAAIGQVFGAEVKADLEKKLQATPLQLSQNARILDNSVLTEIRAYKTAAAKAPFSQVKLSHLQGVTTTTAPGGLGGEPGLAQSADAEAKKIGVELGQLYVGKKASA